jgi:hypothetical protein
LGAVFARSAVSLRPLNICLALGFFKAAVLRLLRRLRFAAATIANFSGASVSQAAAFTKI